MLRNILTAAALTILPAVDASAQCMSGYCTRPASATASAPTTRVSVTRSEYDVPVASLPELPAAAVLPAPVVSAPLYTSTVVSAPVVTYGPEIVVSSPVYSAPVFASPIYSAPVYVGGGYSTFRSRTVVRSRGFAGPAGCFGFTGVATGCPTCR